MILNNRFRLFPIFLILISLPLHGQLKNEKGFPSRKVREDCYFGIHFDLHVRESNDQIGKSLTNEMIDTFLTKVRPDFVQIDCKGHPGISSYPTKVGFPADNYIRDPMKIWREETAKKGVSLYVHFSGLYDRKVATEHPEWAVVDSKGGRSNSIVSAVSPYDSVYIIPQLKELISEYDIDGAWIDGECWATLPDYGEQVINRFKDETGIKNLPKNQADENYAEFLEFNRKLFREYVKGYVDAVHEFKPDFEITSNWAFSSMMPEPVSINVDFLSGDVTPQGGVNRAAFEARCLSLQGKPWDLMPWSFSWSGTGDVPLNTRSAVHMKQEIAQIIAMGGGVQVYFKQNEDLSLQPWTVPIMQELAEFSRLRQKYCHKAKSIPQIGLLYETETFRKSLNKIYGPGSSSRGLEGTLTALLDGQHAVEILMNHHLDEMAGNYPLIIVPEWAQISDEVRTVLNSYVKKGGNLLIIGNKTPLQFKEELGISDYSEKDRGMIYLSSNGILGALNTPRLMPLLAKNTEIYQDYYETNDLRFPEQGISASVTNYGKGKIAAIYFKLGSAYQEYKMPVLRDYLSNMVSKLFTDPLVSISDPQPVHITVNEKDETLTINLINVSGNHESSGILTYDMLPAVRSVGMKIKTDRKPKKVFLIPGEKKIPYKFKDGKVELEVQEVGIHSIVVVEF